MEIFGVGAGELIVIIMVMLIVAGPKRMIHWSYIMGQYMGRLHGLWRETAIRLQQEFDESGVDIRVPQTIPTRQNLQQELQRAISARNKPLEELKAELNTTRREIQAVNSEASSQPVSNQPVSNQPVSNQPVSNQPVSNQPVSNQPVSNQAVSQHAVSNQQS